VEAFLELARRTGSISTYPYLGDVGLSVTGDKKPQTFEDEYLPELFKVLSDLKFNGVSYMPSRNTREQLRRLRSFCERDGLFQVSGEDINTSRQSFVCLAQRDPEFADLSDSTFALVGSEKKASLDGIEYSMFAEHIVEAHPDLSERVGIYKQYAYL
jgi:hypothetical protein